MIQPIFIGGKKTGTELESQLTFIYTNIQSQLQAAPDIFRYTIYSNHGKMALSFIRKQKREEEGAGSMLEPHKHY